MKIMIIEDSSSQSYMYSYIIQKMGYYTTSAINGKDALNKLVKTKKNSLPDLILLDLRMPIMNGFEFLKKIKTEKKYAKLKDIPVLVCTSLNDKPKIKKIQKYIIDCIFKSNISVSDIKIKLINALNSIFK